MVKNKQTREQKSKGMTDNCSTVNMELICVHVYTRCQAFAKKEANFVNHDVAMYRKMYVCK